MSSKSLLSNSFLSVALGVSSIYIDWFIPIQFGVHFQFINKLSGTLARIIFIHLVRSTVSISLTQSDGLPRYYHNCLYIVHIVLLYYVHIQTYDEILCDMIHIAQRHLKCHILNLHLHHMILYDAQQFYCLLKIYSHKHHM